MKRNHGFFTDISPRQVPPPVKYEEKGYNDAFGLLNAIRDARWLPLVLATLERSLLSARVPCY